MAKKKMVPKKKPAPKKKPTPKTYKGKSTRTGGGGKFEMGSDAMVAKGMPRSEADAIMAKRGRKKYGPKKFAQMAATGKKRAARKRKVAKK